MRRLLVFTLGCIVFIIAYYIIFIYQSPHISQKQVKGTQTTSQEEITVVQVIDGDTIVTNTGVHIRYLGINTPEKKESYALEAKQLNEQLVLHKPIRLEFDSVKKDRYGRTLAYVFVGSTFVNKEIVTKGYGIAEFFQKDMLYEKDLTQSQKIARDGCLGMWEGLCNNDQAACIHIPTIHQGEKTNSRNDEWIAIENSCDYFISLGGFLLKDNSSSNRYIFKGTKLLPHQEISLHSGCGTDTEESLYWSCPQPTYAIWNNSGDHAFLYNAEGELVADYQY